MMRSLLYLCLLLGTASPILASEWPAELGREGECAVCVRRGATHGDEPYVAWREHGQGHYGFCSEACANAFDQMPSGYAEPVLPRPAPSFAWSTLEGGTVEPGGQPALLVDFWATWCAPCIQAMPELEGLHREFAADGFQMVGVSIDEDRKDLDSFLERRPVGYPVVHDGGEDPAWWQFRVPAIPAAFLLDAEGNIVAQWSGAIEAAEVRAAIRQLMQ